MAKKKIKTNTTCNDGPILKKQFKSIDFDTLIGQQAKLYACPMQLNTFQLGSLMFEVVEDENDGYRSSMKEVRIIKESPTNHNKFLAEVKILKGDRDTVILEEEEGGHIWLEFGTDNSDSYYPNFVFNWNPKQKKKVIEIIKKINL